MRLVSIAARRFKGLDVELADLAPDLNLVVGPNESGKSRLVLALFYALFERYKGESEDKKALRSHGSSEPPAVEVKFEARGSSWTLKKQFLKGAFARLEGGGRTWTDDDAESMVRELWGTRAIAGKRDVDQFLGMWPLLWVRQGYAGVAPHAHMNDDARATLRDALARQIDEVAAGPLGERVVARAEKERERYYTAASGRETGELAAARARLADAQAELAAALAKRAEAHGTADELAAIGRELAGLDARIAPQRARVAEASARLERATAIAARLRAHESDAARRKAEAELADRALKERDALGERVAGIDRRVEEERAALAPARAASEAIAKRDGEIAARAEAANAALAEAHATHAKARRRAQQADVARREKDARERLARAAQHEARVTEMRAALAEARVDDAAIARVRRASEALAKAGAALAAASASVTLHAARDLVVDGAPLREGETRAWTCDAPARIVIEGVGAIDVRPGGDLDARRAKEQEARQALARELDRVGAASAGDAEQRFARRTALAAQLAQAEPLLVEAAPRGVAALEAEARARSEELAALGAIDDAAPAMADAEARVAAATDAATKGRIEREASRVEVARGLEALARHEQAIVQLAREKEEAQAQLATLRAREELAAAAADAKTRWIDALAHVTALAEEHAKSGEDDARLAAEEETRALERLDAERAAKQTRATRLDAVVQAQGGDDLHERVQRAEADVDERTAALRAIEARAAAARALVTALHAARRDVQERLVAPVLDRVGPYLDALVPGRRVRMDAEWNVLGVGMGDVEDDFESLSGGAKEQVSIVVRLALAEVLGAREPLPIVLDDCLVNTDRARLEAMLRVIQRASRTQQILLLSCHEDAFAGLGGRRFVLGGGSVR